MALTPDERKQPDEPKHGTSCLIGLAGIVLVVSVLAMLI